VDGARLAQHGVDQGGLAVVDMGDDGDIAQIGAGPHGLHPPASVIIKRRRGRTLRVFPDLHGGRRRMSGLALALAGMLGWWTPY
jgi:hypothetical protein